jgi:hypothetical protein
MGVISFALIISNSTWTPRQTVRRNFGLHHTDFGFLDEKGLILGLEYF